MFSSPAPALLSSSCRVKACRVEGRADILAGSMLNRSLSPPRLLMQHLEPPFGIEGGNNDEVEED